jgi:AcrR family transcriptional regulator
VSDSPRAPRLGRPPAADSATRRHAIVIAARRRFATHGYDGTTLSGVAKDTGITLGALYHYFDDKSALYEAVFDASLELVWNRIEDRAARSGQAGARLAALLDIIEHVGRELADETKFLPTVPLDTLRHPELRHLLDKRAEIQERQLRRIVAPAFDAGEMPAFTDLNTAVAAVQILVIGWGLENHYVSDRSSAKGLRQAAQVLLDQLVTPAFRVVGGQRRVAGTG